MRIEFAPRSITDRREIIAYYLHAAGPSVAASFDERLAQIIDRLRHSPETGPRVSGRPTVRVLLLRRFPFKTFYQVSGDVVRILHIRHTARRPWSG
ncbi:MAG TPA: type II toxin-antitoxin system RelE/ParE family toxin [Bauldia sp.]|nr:type II toxin-antitoxin system RelE/ParE family toxin [Bauldia sp.]